MKKNNEKELRMRLDAYLKGALNEAEIQELWYEFAEQPHLLDELEMEVHVREAILRSKDNSASEPVAKKRPAYIWLFGAAAVLALVAMLQFFRVDTNLNLDQMLVQNITVAELETANSLRASGESLPPVDSLLNRAFEKAIAGNTQVAAEIYEDIIIRSEKNIGATHSKAHLNRGILYYNEGNYKEAIEAFKEADEDFNVEPRINEKILWYLANALLHDKQLDAGIKVAKEVYELEGVYRKPAFLLLKKNQNDESGIPLN